MGCKAITPHLVSLAKRLEGRPFHLLASHCQRGTQSEVVAYLQSQGMDENPPNVTVSSQTRHPDVKGNGYVPYYVVFDHRGKMAHHHMCGAYHGGDGLEMIKWVDKLLDAAPAIYLGDEPYEHLSDLAAKIQKRKGLATSVKQLEALAQGEDEPKKEEATRLLEKLGAWRDRRIDDVNLLLATEPSSVSSAVKDLNKELAGTELGKPVGARAAELIGSQELKRSLALEKAHAKVWKSVRKLKVPKGASRRGIEVFNPKDVECRMSQRKALAKLVAKLEKALIGNDSLPYADTVRKTIDLLN